jgi:nitrate reductase alpha subunit
VPYFADYAKRFTDPPFLIALDPAGDAHEPGRFLRPADLGETSENAEWKTVVIDSRDRQPIVPKGSIGFRWGPEGEGRWNLDLGEVDPLLTLLGVHDEVVDVELVRFDNAACGMAMPMRRSVPAKRVGGHLSR